MTDKDINELALKKYPSSPNSFGEDENYFARSIYADGIRKGMSLRSALWISVSDRTPETDGQYLCHVKPSDTWKDAYLALWFDDGEWLKDPSWGDVDYWMEIQHIPSNEKQR